MKFVCDKCRTKYSIADEKVRRKVLKIRCKNCANIIVVRDSSRREGSASSSRVGAGTVKDADALEQAFDGAFGAPAGGGGRRVTGSAPARRRRSSTGHRALAAVARATGPQLGIEPELEDELEPEETRVSSTMDMLAPPGAEDEWYLTVDGHQFGPMSFDELGSRVKRGEARGDDAYVWRDGFDDWLDVAKVPELRPFAPPPPPPPARSGLFPAADPDSSVSSPPVAPVPPPRSLERPSALAGMPRQTGPLPTSTPPLPPPPTAAAAPPPPAPAPPPSVRSSAIVATTPAPTPPPTSAAPMMSVPAPLEAGIKHLPASYADRPDMTLPPALMPVAPAPTKTPALIKVAAIAGILSTLTGIAILVYFLFFDRPAKRPVQPTLKNLAMNTKPAGAGTAVGVAPTKPAASPDAGAVQLEFPPVDVKHTAGRRPKRTSGRTKVAVKRPKRGKKLTAAQRRLLAQMGDTKLPASGVPKARKGRRASRPARQITGGEVGALQRRNKYALKACYQRSLKRDDSLKEIKATIQVKVGTSGKVIKVSVGGVSDYALRSCLQRSIKRWFFKPLGGRTSQTVEFPLIFRGS